MLALVGSGEYLPPMESVDRALLAHLDQPARVVCLPTAAGQEGAERIRYWSELGVAHFTRLGAQVEALPLVDRQSAGDPAIVERIRQANFIYFSGGQPFYLFSSIKDSPAWEAIAEVLGRGGILAGCSAGAMILGERFNGFPRWSYGFNLVPAIIIPHFDEFSIRLVRGMRILVARGRRLIGIDGSTALIKNGEHYHVAGRGSITIMDHLGERSFRAGETVFLPS